jgi:hypothetical protein
MEDGNLYLLEAALKVIGVIFTVCFPLVVGLLWNMSRDIHAMSEKIVAVSTSQLDQAALVGKLEAVVKQQTDILSSTASRLSALEQKMEDHENDDRKTFRRK